MSAVKQTNVTTPLSVTPLSVTEVVAAMKAASDSEMADMMAEMWRGHVIFQERCRAAGTLVEEEVSEEVAATPAKAKEAKAPAAPKKVAKAPAKAPAKAKKEAVPIPEGEEVPTAASYRLDASEIKAELCQARRYASGSEDKRWTPVVYREAQCTGKPVEGTELCSRCATRFEKESQDEKFKTWLGLITEDPESTTHMLGTAWAAKCKWIGVPVAPVAPVAGADADADVTVSTPPPAASAPAAPAPAAPAPAAPAPKAKKAAAPKAAKKEAPVPAPVVAAAAAAVSEPPATAGELELIEGEFYWIAPLAVHGKKLVQAFAYDQIEEQPADFVGRRRADESLDQTVGEIRSIGGEFYWIVRSEVEEKIIHQVYDYDHEADKKGSFVGRLKKDGSIDGDAEEEEVE